MITYENIGIVILAGGQARRMGGVDKSLKKIGDKDILSHIINRVKGFYKNRSPNILPIIINANDLYENEGGKKIMIAPAKERFSPYPYDIVGDIQYGNVRQSLGPLQGILTGMDYFINRRVKYPAISHILSLPGDAPFIPPTLLKEFLHAMNSNDKKPDIIQAASHGRTHPTVGLWPLSLYDALYSALFQRNIRKIDLFCDDFNVISVTFNDDILKKGDRIDPFFNINSLEDLQTAQGKYTL